MNSKGNAGHNKELKPRGSIVSIDLPLIDLRETKISFYGMKSLTRTFQQLISF